MFRKNKTEKSDKKRSGGKSIPTVIAQDMHILGNIVCDGTVDFNGTIDGNIRCETLTVRKEGVVKGEIIADSIYVYGKTEGLIKARHAHLYSSCHIEGIVMHESIRIEDGAFIDGKCKRTNKPASNPPLMDEKDEDDGEETIDNIPKIMENIRLIS